LSDSLALQKLMAGALDDDVRTALQARIDAGHDPHDILVELESGDLLAAVAGDPLSASEQDDLFASILAGVDAETADVAQQDQSPAPVAVPRPANSTRWLGPLILAAVALLAVLPAVLQPTDPYDGVKGDVVVPELRVFLGDGKGGVSSELVSPATVESGAVLLFRYGLTVPSEVELLVREQGEQSAGWKSDGVQPPGEYEVTANGSVLAFGVDKPVEFALVVGESEPVWFEVKLKSW